MPSPLCASMVKITHRGSKILGGEEDHDDAAVAEESDDPEDEEEDAEHVGDQRVLRGKLPPERVDDALKVFGEIIELTGALRIERKHNHF